MSTWAAIHEACLDLVETVSGLVRSPMPIGEDGLLMGDAPGPVGGHFTIAPAVLAYGLTVAGRADCNADFLLTFTWAADPDPNTRIAEAMDRAEAIRAVLLDESQAVIPEARFEPGDPAFTYPSPAVIVVAIPFRIFTLRTT